MLYVSRPIYLVNNQMLTSLIMPLANSSIMCCNIIRRGRGDGGEDEGILLEIHIHILFGLWSHHDLPLRVQVQVHNVNRDRTCIIICSSRSTFSRSNRNAKRRITGMSSSSNMDSLFLFLPSSFSLNNCHSWYSLASIAY